MGSNPTPGTDAREAEPLGRYVFADRLERRRWRFLGAALLVFVVVVGSLAFAPRPEGTSTRLIVHRASVQARAPQAPTFVPVHQDEELGGGEEIRTDPSGSAGIEYFDGSRTDLDGGTVFKVLELSDTPERRTLAGRLESGRVWNSVRADDRARFEVRIAHAWVVGSPGVHLIDCRDAPECMVVGIQGDTQVDIDGGTSVMVSGGRCVAVDGGGRRVACDYPAAELCWDAFTRDRFSVGRRGAVCPDAPARQTPPPTPSPTPSEAPPVPRTAAPASSAQEDSPATSTAAERHTPEPTSGAAPAPEPQPTPTPEPQPTPTLEPSPTPQPTPAPEAPTPEADEPLPSWG